MNQEWSRYIENLSWKHSDIVRQLWLQLTTIIPNIRIPQAGLSPDENSFYFVWDNQDHYLELEFFPNANLEWFYRNKVNNTFTGSNEPIEIIDDELIVYLNKYST